MKKRSLATVLLCVAAGFGFADQGLILREAYGDFSFLGIQAGRVYIFTGENFHVFDLKDGTPLKTFGKIGQGPGEYASYFAFPVFLPDVIVLNNMTKANFYTPEGIFLKSVRLDSSFYRILPLGSGYIRQKTNFAPGSKERDTTIEIVNDAMEPIREIFRRKSTSGKEEKTGIGNIDPAAVAIDIAVDSGKIYVGNPETEISISIYNAEGGLIRAIRRDADALEKRPAEEHRMQAQGQDIVTKIQSSQSAFRFFQVEKGLIYLFTHKKNGDKSEVIVLDEEGKEVASAWVTRTARMSQCIYEKKLYYVDYDDKSGELALHSETIFK